VCGVCGYLSGSIEREQGSAILSSMCGVMRHRGPDDKAILIRGATGIGFVRLSILDLEKGMQPIVSGADSTAIACNGQIYNYIELRQELPAEHYATRGDMEVALNAYRHHGIGFPAMLNGMFAGAIHDPARKRLLLFRDRFGIKPLYFTENSHGFFFASEIKPLLCAPGVSPELDRELLPVYLTYRYVPGERTLFKGIRKLLPASYLELDTDSGSFTTGSYWNWNFQETGNPYGLEEAAAMCSSLFHDAVRIRLRSDVEVGSLLSGGIDSSAVAAVAAMHKPRLKLFTIGFEESGYDETGDVDRFIALMPDRFMTARPVRRICRRNHLAALPELIRAIEEPISLGTMLPTDQVCRLASDHVKVVLSGEGADEIFAGYRKFLVEAALLRLPAAEPSERKQLERLYPEILGRSPSASLDNALRHISGERLFSSAELENLLGVAPVKEDHLDSLVPGIGCYSSANPISAMQGIDSLTRLPNYVNLRLDKLSMRHSLETRTPFLDYRLAEFSAGLPVDLRVDPRTGMNKLILREAFRRHRILPEEITGRAKKPFTMPIANWFADPSSLPERFQDVLLGKEVDRQGILNGDFVRKCAAQVTGNGVGPETMVSAGDRIFALVVFSIWYGEFMEGKSWNTVTDSDLS
jgi:asparagine synthase (glutamine-hydrolysing)